MDLYHIWCDLKPGVRDLQFTDAVGRYLRHLQADNRIAGWRLTRCKLGLRPPDLGEWHIIVEVIDLAQLDAAFRSVASRAEPVEEVHFGVNALVHHARFALYRDFPDPVRQLGEERF